MKFSKEELDDIASEVSYRLEVEYTFYEVKGDNDSMDQIYGTCYVTPPAIGDHVASKKGKVYKVVAVVHPLGSDFSGAIYVKEVKEVKF